MPKASEIVDGNRRGNPFRADRSPGLHCKQWMLSGHIVLPYVSGVSGAIPPRHWIPPAVVENWSRRGTRCDSVTDPGILVGAQVSIQQ